MKKDTINELLLRSFDEELSPEERAGLDAALADSEALRLEKQQLEKLRNLLGGLQAEVDRTFAGKVMSKVSISPVEATLLSLLPRAAAPSLIFLLLTLIGIYLAEGSLSTDATIGVSNLAPEDAYTYLEY